MTAREKMIKFREDRQLDYKMLSDICGVGHDIIGMVEHGDVTHPLIVKKLQELYSLTDLEAEELLPKCRRPHDPEYEPDKYVVRNDIPKNPRPLKNNVNRKDRTVVEYVAEKNPNRRYLV